VEVLRIATQRQSREEECNGHASDGKGVDVRCDAAQRHGHASRRNGRATHGMAKRSKGEATQRRAKRCKGYAKLIDESEEK
jgi:hypothetical protein